MVIISYLNWMILLKNGSYESPLGFDNVDWFVNEVNKLEKK